MADQPTGLITSLSTENFSVAALVAAHNAACSMLLSFSLAGSSPDRLAEQYAKLFRSTYNAIRTASD